MFEVGFSELLLIMGLSLLVLGPEKLPKVVGEIGRWLGRARAMARQFREQLEEEAHDASRRASSFDVPGVTPAPTASDAPASSTHKPVVDEPLVPMASATSAADAPRNPPASPASSGPTPPGTAP